MGEKIVGQRSGQPAADDMNRSLAVRQQVRHGVEFSRLELAQGLALVLHHGIGEAVEDVGVGRVLGPTIVFVDGA